ncbi:hypothetical protein NDA16_003234 [Ustilago loliicola]|nr:hypothetical protein NDA16_003234 [Ustilago loliicola]
MPPFLSVFRSRTNSLLDTITGIIPDSPSDGTSKDNSLTCRKCGNRFRDRLELSSHLNLLPHHSDYADSHNYDSFTRPKGRRVKSNLAFELDASSPSAFVDGAAPSASFSETQAYYAVPGDDKEPDSLNARPALLRKFPTLSSLNITATGDQQPQSPPPTDSADSIARSPRSDAKGKGKQRAMPRLRRDDSFQCGQPLASSDEDAESQPRATGSSNKPPSISVRTRAHSESMKAMTSRSSLNDRPRSSTSSVTSRSSRALASEAVGQAPPLPPKLPMFEWQEKSKQSSISLPDSADDTASIDSDASFRTAGSTDKTSEKSRLKQSYAARDASEPSWGSPSTSSKQTEKELPPRPRARHASESNLLLESMSTSHDDAPPSYHELHDDRDPFGDFTVHPGSTSRHFVSRSDGFATVPSSPVSRVDIALPQPQQHHKAGAGASRRSRQSSRAKSDAAAPSTRCPTCFVKFATLDKTLEHLDNSDCGAVEFESGIM